MLVIDGAFGEGGGQIIRTALTLSVMLTRPVKIINIRANRKSPGLAAQHLAAVEAAAMISEARVRGNHLESTELTFEPQSPPIAGMYQFDVAQFRQGGSAGAATLVLQTILLPLIYGQATSEVNVLGGTHVAWSPSFHYLQQVYLPALKMFGVQAQAELHAWGWYPAGGGKISAAIPGQQTINGTVASTRGPLQQIRGVAVASSLPAHIAQRIRNRAVNLLQQAGLPAEITPQRVRSASPGAGIFLTAEYEQSRAGFSALGKKGKPSEQVAQEAVDALLAFHHCDAVLDAHLADQLIVAAALAQQPVTLHPERITSHTTTNLWVVEQFLGPVASVDFSQNLIEFRRVSNRV